MPITYRPMEDRILEQVSGENLMEITAAIAERVRTSGSPEEMEAFRWVEERLKSYNFDTELTTHEAYVSVPLKGELTVDGESIDAIAHAFATSTPTGGVTGEVVFVEAGAPVSREEAGGKIVLTPGSANGHRVRAYEEAGAIAQIFIHDEHLHETSLSPIWGNPTAEKLAEYPTTPSVAIRRADGQRLRERLKQSPLQATIQTKVDTGWRQIPVLTATSRGVEQDDYLLFSSHIDSWHYGAMDNGAANATAIEVGRIIAKYPSIFRRKLKLAFWSGHSHARFAGSAWYADRHWQDLRQHCVGHVYVDSTGGIGASVIVEAPVMAETKELAAKAIEKITGEEFEGKRIGRFADQSFYGVGLPSIFGTFSEQPAEETEGTIGLRTGGKRSGGLGWWWHTTEDTMDKIDEANLVRDTRVYTDVIYRILSATILPYDERAAVAELRETVDDLSDAARGVFDLSELRETLASLDKSVKAIYKAWDTKRLDDEQIAAANQTILELAHHLVPIAYHENGLFEHDRAEPLQPIPALQPLRTLATLPRDSDEFYLLLTRLRRSYNWVLSEAQAAAIVADTAQLLFV